METVPGTTLGRVIAAVDERAGEIVEFAAELIRQPSVNPDLEPNELAERPAQDWLRDQFGLFDAFDTVAGKSRQAAPTSSRFGRDRGAAAR